MMKIVGVLLGLLGVVAAHASFEMALVVDSTNDEIDRYDPVNNVYLGSFGRGFIGNATQIAIDQGAGNAYVVDATNRRIVAFDYNTGEFIGVLPVVTGLNNVTRLSNGQLIQCSTTASYRTDTSGNLIQSINTGGIPAGNQGCAQTSDGTIWYLSGGPGQFYKGSVGSASVTAGYNFSNPMNAAVGISARGQQIAAVDSLENAANYDHRLSSFTASSLVAGSIISESSILISPTSSVGAYSTAIGHGGVVYATMTTGASSTLYRWIPGNTTYSSMTLSNTPWAYGMALVVAPEPSPWIMFAMGSLAVIRGRRRNGTGLIR